VDFTKDVTKGIWSEKSYLGSYLKTSLSFQSYVETSKLFSYSSYGYDCVPAVFNLRDAVDNCKKLLASPSNRELVDPLGYFKTLLVSIYRGAIAAIKVKLNTFWLINLMIRGALSDKPNKFLRLLGVAYTMNTDFTTTKIYTDIHKEIGTEMERKVREMIREAFSLALATETKLLKGTSDNFRKLIIALSGKLAGVSSKDGNKAAHISLLKSILQESNVVAITCEYLQSYSKLETKPACDHTNYKAACCTGAYMKDDLTVGVPENTDVSKCQCSDVKKFDVMSEAIGPATMEQKIVIENIQSSLNDARIEFDPLGNSMEDLLKSASSMEVNFKETQIKMRKQKQIRSAMIN